MQGMPALPAQPLVREVGRPHVVGRERVDRSRVGDQVAGGHLGPCADPYALGLLLGDGCLTTSTTPSFTTADPELVVALESALEGARALDAGLTRGDLSARAFCTFNGRQRARYRSFRRFVLGFYTAPFRDLFFSTDPPPRLFRAVVTVLAGYWHPSLLTRFWLELFFLSVRMQARLGFAPSHLAAGSSSTRSNLIQPDQT